jgi:hypothetical protein
VGQSPTYPRFIWTNRIQGATQGRSDKHGTTEIKDALKRKGMDITQAKNWTKDRARWRALCKPSKPTDKRGSDEEDDDVNVSKLKCLVITLTNMSFETKLGEGCNVNPVIIFYICQKH